MEIDKIFETTEDGKLVQIQFNFIEDGVESMVFAGDGNHCHVPLIDDVDDDKVRKQAYKDVELEGQSIIDEIKAQPVIEEKIKETKEGDKLKYK